MLDRQDAGPDDLGHVGALVEAQPEDGGDQRRDQAIGVAGQPRGPERDAERDLRVQEREVEPHEQLDQNRRARKNQMYTQLDPDRSGLSDRRMTARITPSTIPIAMHDDGEQECDPETGQYAPGQEVAPDDVPLEPRVRDQRVHEHRRQDEHDDGSKPPPGVADRDRLDLLRRGLARAAVSPGCGVVTAASDGSSRRTGHSRCQLVRR